MSLFHGASGVTISGGSLIAAAPGSTVTIDQGKQTGINSALKDLSGAAAHTAMHDSAARFDAPRCHRNTRAKYRDQLELWMLGKGDDLEGKRLIWLYGGAGAGKSAIIQSVVEHCVQFGVILGTFFFSRADPSRNYAEVLIPSLAYQLARSFPAAMAILEPLIHADPLIFKASLHTQAYELLVRPIQYLLENKLMGDHSLLRRVFVIDGLDECDGPPKQALIIRVITSILEGCDIPVCFLVASRPEGAISSAFAKENRWHEIFSTLTLDHNDDAESDIQQFIEDSFLDIIDTHPLRQYISLPWPDQNSIYNLVLKSSGHFIYAAIATKFIALPDEHPGRALKVIEGLEPSRTGSPFAELDALYMHILTSAKHSKQVLEILRHCYLSSLSPTVAAVCYIHDISPPDVSLFLSDVQSLVTLSLDSFAEVSITSRHASLRDFLLHEERSQALYMSQQTYQASLLGRHFQLLDNGGLKPSSTSFLFRPPTSYSFWWDGSYIYSDGDKDLQDYVDDVDGLISDLADGLVSSEDTDLLQSVVSHHGPHDIWNFCVESLAHDVTISTNLARAYLARQICKYMRAIRDSIPLRSDGLYFDQFKMYMDLLLDDLNDVVHQKPQYRMIPALMLLGSRSGLLAAHDLLCQWGRQFRIDVCYQYYFWYPLVNKSTRKVDPRAFKALRCSPRSQLSWGSDLAIAMELVLHHLVNLPWPGPSDALYTTPHKKWLRQRKPLKWISLGCPRLSSTTALLMSDFHKAHKPFSWRSSPRAHSLLCSFAYLASQARRQHKILKHRKKCIALLETVVHYLPKADYTSKAFRLAQRSLPIAAQWSPRLMKRARYEMDIYVHRWEGPLDCLLKKSELLSINDMD